MSHLTIEVCVRMAICPNCGRITPEGKFCENCGASLESVNIPQPVPFKPPEEKKRSVLSTILMIIGGIVLLFIVFGIIGAVVMYSALSSDPTKITYPTYSTISPTAYPGSTTAPVIQGHGSISVRTNPGGAQVFLNGQYRGSTPSDSSTPLIIDSVDTGVPCTIELKKTGYIFEDQTFQLSDGQIFTINKVLTHVPVRTN
jgi:hypothetical protein